MKTWGWNELTRIVRIGHEVVDGDLVKQEIEVGAIERNGHGATPLSSNSDLMQSTAGRRGRRAGDATAARSWQKLNWQALRAGLLAGQGTGQGAGRSGTRETSRPPCSPRVDGEPSACQRRGVSRPRWRVRQHAGRPQVSLDPLARWVFRTNEPGADRAPAQVQMAKKREPMSVGGVAGDLLPKPGVGTGKCPEATYLCVAKLVRGTHLNTLPHTGES